MTNSYKNYSTNLERMKIKEKHEERRALVEKREHLSRKEWIKEKKQQENLWK